MADGGRDLVRGRGPLHAHRIDLHVQAFEAASQDVEDVANGRAVRAGDHGDALRQHRDGPLAVGVEEPFIRQPFLELLEGELQRAQARGLRHHRVELELAFLFVDGEPPAHDELQSVLDAEAEEARVGGEEDHAHLRARVLDREVEMSGRGARVVRHFAFHGDVVVTIEIEIELPDQLAHCEDALSHGHGRVYQQVRQAHCSSTHRQ